MTILLVFLWAVQRSIITFGYLLIGKIFFKTEITVKKWLSGSLMAFASLAIDYLLGLALHPAFLIAEYALFARFWFPQPWKKAWQGTLTLFTIGEIAEILLVVTSKFLFTAEEQALFDNRKLLIFPTFKLNFIGALLLLLVSGLLLLGKNKLSKFSFGSLMRIPLWLRLSLSAAVIVSLAGWYWSVAEKEAFWAETPGIMTLALTIFVVLVLVLSILRDIAQSRLERRNRALGATQQSIASFLFEMRAFRHDIANMLYGWQGAVMEGDLEKIKAYSAEMRNTFTLINNDNTLNLQKLASGSVRGLLSEKLQSAERSGVPAFLYVDGVYDRFRMKDSDLVRLLGILADNAIRAASDCDCPMVHIHVFQEDGSIRFLVRNTAKDSLLAATDALDGTPGEAIDYTSPHGIGLKSAREIVSRYPKAELFLYTRSRYVEACLALPA
ncbi:MAG: GHKL domain-containing protein [Clostridia bacterium]|nr:GHKL domain-containing protein [Clostridia bacterium]